MQTMTIIVPCYNEEEALPYFYEEISKIRQQLTEISLKLLFINDGSTDNTLAILKKLASSDSSVYYISFSRNFGKEAAIYAGLKNSTSDYTAIMDADLQDPPSLLPSMLHAIREEGYDSVATRRVNRKGEPPVRSFFARMFYKLIRKMSDTDIVDGARDFRLMNRPFVDALLELNEYNRFSKGLFGWVGFRTKWIEFENTERIAGETKWSFFQLVRYSLDGMISFSTAPLKLASFTGMFMCIIPCHYLYYCKAAFIRWLRFRLAVHGMYRYLYRRYPASVHRNLRFLPFPHLYGGQKTAYLYLQGKQFKPR